MGSPLPRLVTSRLDRALGELMAPRGAAFDFLAPAGEAALIAHDSLSWRVFRNPVSVFVGGAAAVILELAEPRVRSGVWEFTSFKRDPVQRMKRTGMAAMATVYGARSKAEALIAGVVRAHERIEGVTPEGERYRANDVELLDWVQATAGFGFVEAYGRFVRPLSIDERDRAMAEGAEAARLYGAVGAPGSWAEMEALFERMRPKLRRSEILSEYLAIMNRAPVMPFALRPVQRMLVRAAVSLVPDWARADLGIGRLGLRLGEETLVRRMARMAEGLVLEAHPAAMACRRLGLPADYLLD
jgi:uncharacterized protein (DUF2236 family)